MYEVSGAFTINNIGCFESKQKQKQNKRVDKTTECNSTFK